MPPCVSSSGTSWSLCAKSRKKTLTDKAATHNHTGGHALLREVGRDDVEGEFVDRLVRVLLQVLDLLRAAGRLDKLGVLVLAVAPRVVAARRASERRVAAVAGEAVIMKAEAEEGTAIVAKAAKTTAAAAAAEPPNQREKQQQQQP